MRVQIIMDETVATLVMKSWFRALGGQTEAFGSIYTELVARGETYRCGRARVGVRPAPLTSPALRAVPSPTWPSTRCSTGASSS